MKYVANTKEELEAFLRQKVDCIIIEDPALIKRVLRVKKFMDIASSAQMISVGLAIINLLRFPFRSGIGPPINVMYSVRRAGSGRGILDVVIILGVAALAMTGMVVAYALYNDYDVEMHGPAGIQQLIMRLRRKEATDATEHEETAV